MAYTRLLYGGIDLTPYGYDLQPPKGGTVKYSAQTTLGATKVFGFSSVIDAHDLACSGVISSALFASLEALLNSSNTLVCSNGTCTAVLTVCLGTPRAGDSGGGGHLMDVTLAFCKTSAWS